MLRARAVRLATAVLLLSMLPMLPAIVGCRSEETRLAEASDGTLLSPYLAIGEVLTDDSVAGLPELAAKIVEASEASASEPGVEAMLIASGRIATPDIATARSMYAKMSEGMIANLAAHPERRAGLLLIYCPMTFNNAGAYWVQRAGKIANPYEGAMMLHCGAKLAWADHREGQPPAGSASVEGMEAQ